MLKRISYMVKTNAPSPPDYTLLQILLENLIKLTVLSKTQKVKRTKAKH